MVDYTELMSFLSVPRPNGSENERRTRIALQEWLEQRGIDYELHTFRLYPFLFEAIGLWLILSRTLLAVAIWFRWGWPTFFIAILGCLGGLVDVALGFPLVSWPGARKGYNLIINFEPQQPQREIMFSAHYDSKTELLDHRKRLFFLKRLPLGILLTLLLGVIGPLDKALHTSGSTWAVLTFSLGIIMSLVLLFLAWGLGLNLSLGRLLNPSQGAVDNGAACAILLGLADHLVNGEISLRATRVTLALFTGEEVNMQGSRAYTLSRGWHLPAIALNLEVMGQNGEYVYWEQDGSSLKLVPTSPEINRTIASAVTEVTGSPARPAGPVNSDGYSFMRAGIPCSTLGSYDLQLRDRGFHQPTDNLGRVDMQRLPEAVKILERFIQKYETGEVKLPNLKTAAP